LRLYSSVCIPTRPHRETNDLIYEGIATDPIQKPSRFTLPYETNDLIYEGIATIFKNKHLSVQISRNKRPDLRRDCDSRLDADLRGDVAKQTT